jgi:hypothetical protein
MNPNLHAFFTRSLYVVLFVAIAAGLFYVVDHFTTIDLSVVGEYIMYGFFGATMVFMFVLIIGVMLKSLWVEIMNRADSIVLCCPDRHQDGVHIVAMHHHAGGESTSGFSSYLHYYIDNNGKSFLSKKVKEEGKSIGNSLEELSEKTQKKISPNLQFAIEIGSNTDGDDAPKISTISISNGTLHVRGYDGLIDYGFKLELVEGHRTRWRMRI